MAEEEWECVRSGWECGWGKARQNGLGKDGRYGTVQWEWQPTESSVAEWMDGWWEGQDRINACAGTGTGLKLADY
ncbi:unnamed protein product [Fusarium graminearum]|uniref:Uncharacterized protein n=1 Tax=Gibberella zeae TaxID=5518 RepID=A0A4E9EMI6_GIBZA|nr:unnamed protein product [Fusarium graminearum]CAG1979066.1 unnamed protein product [Fusarium graminearum]